MGPPTWYRQTQYLMAPMLNAWVYALHMSRACALTVIVGCCIPSARDTKHNYREVLSQHTPSSKVCYRSCCRATLLPLLRQVVVCATCWQIFNALFKFDVLSASPLSLCHIFAVVDHQGVPPSIWSHVLGLDFCFWCIVEIWCTFGNMPFSKDHVLVT
jgi:hypothetical protein